MLLAVFSEAAADEYEGALWTGSYRYLRQNGTFEFLLYYDKKPDFW